MDSVLLLSVNYSDAPSLRRGEPFCIASAKHAQRRGAPLRRRASPCLSAVDAAEHHGLPNITAPGMQQGRDNQGRGRPRRADHFIRARLQGGRFFREGNI